MHLAVIDVKVQGSSGCQDAEGLFQPGLQETQIIIKDIFVFTHTHISGPVPAPLETSAVAVTGLLRDDLSSLLLPSRIEGRIDVD